MSDYLELARRALRLHRQGKTAVEIKQELGLRYAADANRAVDCGLADHRAEEARLTSDEIDLILSVAEWQRSGISKGDTCRPKLKHVGPWHWPRSKAARLAYKRLGTHRAGEDPRERGFYHATGLGLVDAGNGYIGLTRAGWALVHAIEAERAAR